VILSDEHGFCFYAIPRCASTAIGQHLIETYGGVRSHWHRYDPQPGRFRFLSIRHPLERLVSQWWFSCRRGDDRYGVLAALKAAGYDSDLEGFTRWLLVVPPAQPPRSRPLFMRQNEIITRVRPDAILRVEHLDEDFGKLPFARPDDHVPALNRATDGEHWGRGAIEPRRRAAEDYLTPEVEEMARRWAPGDFRLYE